jgi:hypothetical protein
MFKDEMIRKERRKENRIEMMKNEKEKAKEAKVCCLNLLNLLEFCLNFLPPLSLVYVSSIQRRG